MSRITTNVTLHKCLFCCFKCTTLIITLSHKLPFLCYYLLVYAYQCSFGCCCLQNIFVARYSTTLLSKLYMTCFLFDVKFWQVCHFIFCLICYYVCAKTTTVVVLALILYKIKFSTHGFVHNLSFGWVLSHFGHF